MGEPAQRGLCSERPTHSARREVRCPDRLMGAEGFLKPRPKDARGHLSTPAGEEEERRGGVQRREEEEERYIGRKRLR